MQGLNSKSNNCKRFFLLLAFLLCVHLVRGTALDFQKLVIDFQQTAISDFIGYTIKGERYPLIHTISELRYRVFSEKLGINSKSETKACSHHRSYGVVVPESQQKFCKDYDALVDLAKKSVVQTLFFEKIYLGAEPLLLNEIERQRARDPVRVWIRQKLNCLNDKYRCGRNERKMIKRVSNFDPAVISTYIRILKNLEKKLFPEEQSAAFIKTKDLETQCGFVNSITQKNPKPGMILIDSGKFEMGNTKGMLDEQPKLEVELDPFWIDKCEVTNYQYLLVAAQNPFLRKSTFPLNFHDGNYLRNWSDDLVPKIGSELEPVTHVSWYAARYYCNYVGKRLPSEAEWEMAAGAGIDSEYSSENSIEILKDYAWFRQNSGGYVHTTGQKMSNPSGLFDIHGNVWEWVYDWFGMYPNRKRRNPQGPEIGKYRIMRGGSWSDPVEYLRSSIRRDALPNSTYSNVGFRCAQKK